MSGSNSKSDHTRSTLHQISSRKGLVMKAISVSIVAIFMMSSAAVAVQTETQDASGVKVNGYKDTPTGPDYGYKLHYDENNTGITGVEASTNKGAFKDVSRGISPPCRCTPRS